MSEWVSEWVQEDAEQKKHVDLENAIFSSFNKCWH